jgi:hypothetical protein
MVSPDIVPETDKQRGKYVLAIGSAFLIVVASVITPYLLIVTALLTACVDESSYLGKIFAASIALLLATIPVTLCTIAALALRNQSSRFRLQTVVVAVGILAIGSLVVTERLEIVLGLTTVGAVLGLPAAGSLRRWNRWSPGLAAIVPFGLFALVVVLSSGSQCPTH